MRLEFSLCLCDSVVRKPFGPPHPLLLPSPHGPSLDSVALRLRNRRRAEIGLHLLQCSQRKRPASPHRPPRPALLHHSQYLSLHPRTRNDRPLRAPRRVAETLRRCRPGDDVPNPAHGDGSAPSLRTRRHQSRHEHRKSRRRRRSRTHPHAHPAALGSRRQFRQRNRRNAGAAGGARRDLGTNTKSAGGKFVIPLTSTLCQEIPQSPHKPESSSSTAKTREPHQEKSTPRRALSERAAAATNRPSARNQHCDHRPPESAAPETSRSKSPHSVTTETPA